MVTGFVLASGLSSRTGLGKTFLSLQGLSAVEQCVMALRRVCDRVAIVGRKEAAQPLLELEIAPVVEDLEPRLGPLMGIYSGLMATQTRANLFVSCEMPLPGAESLAPLLSAKPGEAGYESVTYAFADGRLQPLPVLADVRACKRIGRLLNARQVTLESWLRRSPNRALLAEEYVFA